MENERVCVDGSMRHILLGCLFMSSCVKGICRLSVTQIKTGEFSSGCVRDCSFLFTSGWKYIMIIENGHVVFSCRNSNPGSRR